MHQAHAVLRDDLLRGDDLLFTVDGVRVQPHDALAVLEVEPVLLELLRPPDEDVARELVRARVDEEADRAHRLERGEERAVREERAQVRLRVARPVRVQPRDALFFAIALATISFSLLAIFANLLCAILAMSGIVFYIGIYTHLLKRHTTQNIVIGGAAGAIPALVGWAAVTGHLSWTAWVIFAIVFLWTPPHFWALALMIRDDYAKVGVPMLPVVAGEVVTARQIWLYTLVLIPVTLLLIYPLQSCGLLYGAIALILGSIFVRKAWLLWQNPTCKIQARSLFLYSILYMMLLCAGMVVDSLPFTHQVANALASSLNTIISTILISR